MKAKRVRQPTPVSCDNCGQRGDEYPSLTLDEFPILSAVFVGDQAVPTPQRLTCNACGHVAAIPRDSIEVRRQT